MEKDSLYKITATFCMCVSLPIFVKDEATKLEVWNQTRLLLEYYKSTLKNQSWEAANVWCHVREKDGQDLNLEDR